MQKGCRRTPKLAILPQFCAIDAFTPHFVRKGCRGHFKIAILPHFSIEPHFVRKGCRGTLKIAIYLSFWRSNLISCERVAAEVVKSQFYLSFWRSNLISCKRVSAEVVKSEFFISVFGDRCRGHYLNFTAVFGDRTSFRAKGLSRTCQNLNFLLLAIEPRFVRKGCVSCRLVGTAPRLQERNEKKERARGQESKRAREKVKM